MASPRTTRAIDVFLDASVLFAAALSARGSACELVAHGLVRRLAVQRSPVALEETASNLAAKAPGALAQFGRFRAAMADQLVMPDAGLVPRVARLVEWKDAPMVGGAVASGSSHLATYDRKHLLSKRELIQRAFGIAAATPSRSSPSRERGSCHDE